MRPELPSGTVTFLFTDVEGSTRLLHELGAEGYAEALAAHRRVIRGACTAEGGVEVDTQGDAFFFAFPTAPGALAAASDFTESLAAGPIQVRVGLHTGTPLLTDEGYVGDDVHFAARVAASGHGGQVILARSTADLVELSLTDLGEHRLKDIEQAVPIYQLGDGSFPPLKTISNTNLPRPASSFVGREDELEEVLSRVRDGARLVTLIGPGGTGKTRLSIEAAATLVPEYRAGVFWVGLATLRDPALVTETIAQTLGAKDGLAEHIADRELLLLLDNLEQVVECAPDLASLLSSCPNLTLLVTSRELLRVQGEVEYPVPPLAESEAVVLFCERSQLEPTEEIAELCAGLDSLPLAVELAAARTKALTPAQILERLSGRLDLLKGGRDSDPRQQTLRTTIEWSYDLLSEEEQQLFARLSVFQGGCTLEAAEEVCDAHLDTLQSLVEKSLLRFTDGRYWMLETIREFAGELLEDSSDGDAPRRRHREHFVRLAEEAEPKLRGSDAVTWLDRLEEEHGNLRVVLGREDGAPKWTQLRVAGALARFWLDRGYSEEGTAWLQSALADHGEQPTHLRARAVRGLGYLAWSRGDNEESRRCHEEALSLYRSTDDSLGIAISLTNVSVFSREDGDVKRAKEMLEESATRLRDCGESALLAHTFGHLGLLALDEGNSAEAVELCEEGLALARAVGADPIESFILGYLGNIALEQGRFDEAEAHFRDSLKIAVSLGFTLSATSFIRGIAQAATGMGEHERAVRLTGAAQATDEALGRHARDVEDVQDDERVLTAARADMGEEFTLEAWREGSAMSFDDAVEYALVSID